MLIAVIFAILLAAVIYAWKGKRLPAIYLFTLSMIISTAWFIHHITENVGLSL